MGYKDIVSETFTGDLKERLARIVAEKGNFNKSREFYTQAISGAYSKLEYTLNNPISKP